MTRIKNYMRIWVMATVLIITACGGNNKTVIPENEGTINSPISLSFDTPYAGTIADSLDGDGHSYYSFTPGVSGKYIISLTGVTSGVDLDWSVAEYISGVPGSPIKYCETDDEDGNGDEVCDLDLLPNTTYILEIVNFEGVNANFTLIIISP